ncbi:DUF6262 family protein [Actinoplanes couchii]|uniref:Transposase n=1 Tax=Actinoplanes couchii TaxID=403638 RepID=A0ABQ3XPL5_9ACTN|nr:DUF6262 family protein [Actinoplanes couchii]MDR6319104.1 hypothetical protein [Actinoplanes couchii]GID60445.1 hypothetical protein Aco03nite_088490 [Actinoplanes couchii]
MSDTRQRRIDNLTDAARRKSQAKVKAAEAAIRRLIKRGDQVTFQAVQREAGVSQNFLYKNPDLRARIEHQRQTQRPTPRPVPAAVNTENNIVTALTAEVTRLKKQHRQEVTELRKALEQAHGENLALRRELQRRGGSDD